jgi:Mrp family chromosome partitioning ATPase/capsular polysaccharide biosynthesis protein
VSAGTAFYLSQSEIRYYIARASLMVGNTFANTAPDQYQLALGSSLARFYAELARREPILTPVQTTLQLPFPWQIVSDRMLTTNVVPSANLLEIYITDTDPQRAAVIANAIGEQLMAYSPTSPDKIEAERAAIEQQLHDTESRIKQTKAKIDELTARQQQMTSASDLAAINDTLAELDHNLSQDQASYNSLLAYKNNSVVNSLTFFERATPPFQALPSKRYLTIGFAGFAGLLISLVAIFILERLDPRWRGPRDVEERHDIENLGHMPIGPPLLIASPVFFEERFQAARDTQTNILLAAPEGGARTLMLTSPQPSESRAAFSIDLADLFSRSGHKVLLVDAEFTKSFMTRMLVSQGASNAWTVTTGNGHSELWSYLRPTPLPNVALLPGRAEADGVPALIPSLRWRELVQMLLGIADVIIFDGPSTLTGPDAALLAPHVEGIVLTLDPAMDSHADVSESKTRLLRQHGSNLLGAVMFTPAKHQFNGRRALMAPQQSAPESTEPATPAPEPAPKPQRPLINLRVFGREFRVVWGQSRRGGDRRTQAESVRAEPQTGQSGQIYPPPGPIVTPPAPVDQVTNSPGQAQDGEMPAASQLSHAKRPRKAPRRSGDQAGGLPRSAADGSAPGANGFQDAAANVTAPAAHMPIITPAPGAGPAAPEPNGRHHGAQAQGEPDAAESAPPRRARRAARRRSADRSSDEA